MFPIIILALLTCGTAMPAAAENMILPPDVFVAGSEESFGVVDITKPPFNAKGDGTADDTEAFIRAIEWVQRKIMKFRNDHPARCNLIYVPDGVYRITAPITSRLESKSVRGVELLYSLRFRGQSREKTILAVSDATPAFADAQHPVPVIEFSKRDFNNAVSGNFFEHLSVRIGKHNPGAIGLKFHGANICAVRHVTITAAPGSGAIGLDLPVEVCQGIYRDIAIRGFAVGIRVKGNHATNPVFEHVLLADQREAAILPGDGGGTFRKITSHNRVTALRLDNPHGQCVIVDSEFTGGSPAQPAIEILRGHLFARNIKLTGYREAVSVGSKVAVRSSYIEEFVSGAPKTLFGKGPVKSLPLPVEEIPEIPWEYSPNTWMNVAAAGAKGDFHTDDSAAIQRAMDSGKANIYCQAKQYIIDQTVTIPATVNRVNFMFAQIVAGERMKKSTSPIFRISGASEQPIILEDMNTLAKDPAGQNLGTHHLIEQATSRTLVLSDILSVRNVVYVNQAPRSKLFIENVLAEWGGAEGLASIPFQFTQNQQVWARWINPESNWGHFLIDNATVWMLGFKNEQVEHDCPNFRIYNHARVEVLGGILNTPGWETSPATPAFEVVDSSLSLCAHTTGFRDKPEMHFTVLVKETKAGVTRTLTRSELPTRDRTNTCIIPLFVSPAVP